MCWKWTVLLRYDFKTNLRYFFVLFFVTSNLLSSCLSRRTQQDLTTSCWRNVRTYLCTDNFLESWPSLKVWKTYGPTCFVMNGIICEAAEVSATYLTWRNFRRSCYTCRHAWTSTSWLLLLLLFRYVGKFCLRFPSSVLCDTKYRLDIFFFFFIFIQLCIHVPAGIESIVTCLVLMKIQHLMSVLEMPLNLI